ncbi:unnamed protein product [Scytosiphon promiscuus]
MADCLEDILGGVEDEIRLAEKRLQLGVFRVERIPAADKHRSQARSKIDGEYNGEDTSEDMDQVLPCGNPATIRRLPSRGASGGQHLAAEVPLVAESFSGRDAAERRAQRHAWGSPEHDNLLNSASSDGVRGRDRGRSFGGSGTNDREAMVNRLLRERDARLAARNSGVVEEKRRGFTGRANDPKTAAVGLRDRDCHGTVNANPDDLRGDGYPLLAKLRRTGNVGEGVGCEVEVVSPSSTRGNIFFASDLLDQIDNDGSSDGKENGENGPATVDPREFQRLPATEEEPIKALLLQFNNDENQVHGHYDVDEAADNELGDDGFSGSVPNSRQSLGHRRAGLAAARGVRGGVSICPPKPGSPETHVGAEARARGPPRAEGRGRFASGDGNTHRSPGASDKVVTARLEEQLAFRPSLGASARPSLQQKPRAGNERRIEELARDRQALYSDRERQRKELQERLHREAREREAARALAHHHVEKEALRECTFQVWSNQTKIISLKNASVENALSWKHRTRGPQKARYRDKEEREGATFAPPPLGRISERLAARDSTSTAARGAPGEGGAWGAAEGRRLGTRLQQQAMWARERRRLRVQEHEEAEARVSTFEPVISRGTKSLIRKRPDLQAPFEQRRAIMVAKRQERERLRQAAQAEEETRWFNPPTARRTESLLRRRMPQRLDETVGERVTRMASAEDQRKRDFVTTQRAKEKLECTFRPSLNSVTRSLGRAAPLDELVHNRRGQRVRERAKQKARNAQSCSHKPVLFAEVSLMRVGTEGRAMPSREPVGGSGRAAGADMYGPGNRYRLSVCEPARMTADLLIAGGGRTRDASFKTMREEKEVAEMQRCTFAPRTNPAIIRAKGPVLVRGLSRHLELKEIALQREHERREREAQAFGVRSGAVRRSVLGETIVEPFSLSSSDSKGWWRERRARHEAERAAQNTFKPWTVEAERGRALSRLLEWSSTLSSESSRRN